MFRLLMVGFLVLIVSTIASAYGGRYYSIAAFSHEKHQQRLGGCTECHSVAGPGRIEEFSQDWGHKTCVGCHAKREKGPVDCATCHPNTANY